MNRIPDVPYVLNLPADLPSWLANALTAAQGNLNHDYSEAKNNYYDHAETYLTTQRMLRGSNRAYQAPPFPLPVPRLSVVTWTLDPFSLGTVQMPTDPAIEVPVLEDLPPDKPYVPPFVPHPAQDAVTVLQPMLEDIQKSLSVITTAMGLRSTPLAGPKPKL